MSATQAVFVLVHGGWHSHSAWDRVTPILEAKGFAALTLDLPGAGVNAIAPTSLGRRPFDPAAFAAERSPVAGITQEERTQAVVALVEEAASRGDGKVILVGHSAGGMTISAVAEQVPHLLRAVVYLAGFMVPNGMPLLAMLQHETMASALAPGLFVGDPAAIGATRIHAGSTDEAYRSLLKAAFYGDVSESEFVRAASHLHCDEPNGGAITPSEITPGRFGTVPRHYIRCTQDRAVPVTGQDHMIATVDGAIGGKTTTHTLDSSHSPFLSRPAALSKNSHRHLRRNPRRNRAWQHGRSRSARAVSSAASGRIAARPGRRGPTRNRDRGAEPERHSVTTSLLAETPRRWRSSATGTCASPVPITVGLGAATNRASARAAGRNASKIIGPTSLAIKALPQMNLVRTPFRQALSVSVMLPMSIRATAGNSHRSRPRPAGTLSKDVGGVARATKRLPVQAPTISVHAAPEPTPIAIAPAISRPRRALIWKVQPGLARLPFVHCLLTVYFHFLCWRKQIC